MSQTIRERILEKLKSRLSDHTWTTLYESDGDGGRQTVQPNIFVGRSIFDPDAWPDRDRLPLVTVVAGMEDAGQSQYAADIITMPVDVSALISLEDATDVFDECEPIFGELRSVVGGDDGHITLTMGEGDDAEDQYFPIHYTGGGIADYPTELGPTIITVVMSCSVTYATATGDPYN